ncbi:hypothetical protein SteCoe_20927 [Stentor coeruleus]|uniref:Phosphodiesterase n=1 Tax=Stentor coeruleus TaxID=5963 RepID=A0A1R2BR50_9CILI|nr:hypothetical protein SteCoe_20927 [Stentor coeruleus]
MKVMDISSAVRQKGQTLEEPVLQSKYSLQFHNSKQEKYFRQVMLSDIATSIGLDHRESMITYIVTLIFVCLLYNSAYLSAYFEGKSYLRTLLFQTLLLSSVTLATSIIHYFFFMKEIKSDKKSWYLIALYFVFSEIVIFNNVFVKDEIFADQSEYGFACVLGLLPMIYSSKFAVFSTFLMYIAINFIISITFLAVSLQSDTNIQKTLIEFFFLISILAIESRTFYTKEYHLRNKFIAMNAALTPESRLNHDVSPKTDLEQISRAVKESIQLLPLAKRKESKNSVYLEKIFDNLSKVINMLGNRNSIYSVDLEGLDKDFDDEDKIFLEQTCLGPRRSQVQASTKYMVRKTIEVLKNYDIQELAGVLKRIGKEWNFDIFFLKDVTKNKPLATVGAFCMQKFHLDTSFSIHLTAYQGFFVDLEDNYKPNPYHNSTHSAEVLCSYVFLIQQSVFTNYIQDYEILASVIAMLGHDVAHPGVTNRFLVNSKNSLAITYNDSSVLEMMHSATTFQLMQKDNQDILVNLPRDMGILVRALIIEMILATDMAKHFDLIGKLKAKMINSSSITLTSADQRIEIMKIITKASDVGHAAKSQDLHQKWTNLVCEEFFTQGDMEKAQGLPISMYCDREKTDIAKSQSGFIKNIVLPIYETLNQCLNSQEIKEKCINQLEQNMKSWESLILPKRVHSLMEPEESHTLKNRTETTVAGRTGRSSWATIVLNN